MTNAEKIRQMDDVQLARFLWIWKINSISAFLANGGYGSMNAMDIGSWVDEDAEDTFVCTETYVGDDFIFDQDFNNKADRKTENSSEKPNNCEELNAYRKCVESRSFWDNKHCDGCYFDERCPFDEPKDEPTISKMEQVEEPQTEPLPKTINGVRIADAVAWADKWLEDNSVTEMWDMIRTLRDATEWQDAPQTDCAWM